MFVYVLVSRPFPYYAVDSSCIVPMGNLEKQEYAAYGPPSLSVTHAKMGTSHHALHQPRDIALELLAPRRARAGASGGVHCRDHGEVQSVLPHVPAGDSQTAQGRHVRSGLRKVGRGRG